LTFNGTAQRYVSEDRTVQHFKGLLIFGVIVHFDSVPGCLHRVNVGSINSVSEACVAFIFRTEVSKVNE
jgi:hypothetical protein